MRKKCPVGLVMIVVYKFFVASLMVMTAIAILFTLKNHQILVQFSESYLLESKLIIIDFILDKIIRLDPKTLRFTGLAAEFYAGITVIEAVGLWHQKVWAELLVVILVCISIPFEILELIRGVSVLKLMIFFLNLAILWYLIDHFYKAKKLLSK